MRKNIVIFTGAGISAESGIPTFRDANGMWGKYDAMKLASIEGFKEDPQAVLDFYNARRRNLLEVEPNHAHLVLADLKKHCHAKCGQPSRASRQQQGNSSSWRVDQSHFIAQ